MSIEVKFHYELKEVQLGLKQLNRLIRKKQKVGRGLVGWLVFFGLAIMFFLLMRANPQPAPSPAVTPPAKPIDLFLQLVPWALIFGFIWFFVFREIRGGNGKKLYDGLRMEQMRTLIFDEHGVSITKVTESTRYLWPAFVRFEQTKEFLFLFLSPISAQFIPKRVFEDEQLRDQVINLVRTNISAPISAFPVIPMGTKADTH
ncbi:hypothetical protein BH10PLA1_BH10PLA1_11780 [soil metagenome]